MKNFKMLLALVLALAMVLCFAACTEKNDDGEATTAPSTEATDPSTEANNPPTEATDPSTEATDPSTEATDPSTEANNPPTESTEPTAPSSYAYAIKVVDANGNPVAGAWVQLCSDANCQPKQTDANGIAGYTADETPAGDKLKAQILTAPGFTTPAENIQYFENGVTEIVFTVTAA